MAAARHRHVTPASAHLPVQLFSSNAARRISTVRPPVGRGAVVSLRAGTLVMQPRSMASYFGDFLRTPEVHVDHMQKNLAIPAYCSNRTTFLANMPTFKLFVTFLIKMEVIRVCGDTGGRAVWFLGPRFFSRFLVIVPPSHLLSCGYFSSYFVPSCLFQTFPRCHFLTSPSHFFPSLKGLF